MESSKFFFLVAQLVHKRLAVSQNLDDWCLMAPYLTHIHVTYIVYTVPDILFVASIWYTYTVIYDIWDLIHDIWYMIHDILYLRHNDYMMYDPYSSKLYMHMQHMQ